MPRNHHRAFAVLGSLLAAPATALADWAVDILPPASPMAQDAYDLHWGIMYVCIAIFFIVFGAMFWSIYKHRRSKGAKAAQFHENTTIEVIWTVVPLVVLVAMAWPATKTMLEMKDASNADMSIKVTAYQWRWEYEYLQDGVRFVSNMSTPRDQIDERNGGGGAQKGDNYLLEVDRPVVVPVNKKVRLLVTSNDVIHGWYVPQLGVNQYGIPGFVKDAWFTATQVGTFRGQCSQICGKEHSYMPIVVEVKSEADYARWLEEQKAKMPPPTPTGVPQQAPAQTAGGTAEQLAAAGVAAAGTVATTVATAEPGAKMPLADLKARGEQVYGANCAACHQPTGKGMPPTFPALAGSKVTNGPKGPNIAVVLKGRPGTAMAPFARLSDADLAAVITYTRTAFGNKGDEVQPAEIAAARKAP